MTDGGTHAVTDSGTGAGSEAMLPLHSALAHRECCVQPLRTGGKELLQSPAEGTDTEKALEHLS